MDWRDVRTDSLEGMVALTAVKGVGPASAGRIVSCYETLGCIVADDRRIESAAVRSPNKTVLETLRREGFLADFLEHAMRDIERVAADGGFFVRPGEEAYPSILERDGGFAPILRVYGTLPDHDVPWVACVGTRDPNRFGAQVTRMVADHVVSDGGVVVSGMAKGVDRISHDRAVAAGAPTVAVLGCGFGELGSERSYARSIVESGGAVISQFETRTRTSAGNLLSRNDVVAGLGHGMACLQGSSRTGGTRKAMSDMVKRNRPVFVPVPPPGHEDAERDCLVDIVGKAQESPDYAELSFLFHSRADFPAMMERIRREIPSRASEPEVPSPPGP